MVWTDLDGQVQITSSTGVVEIDIGERTVKYISTLARKDAYVLATRMIEEAFEITEANSEVFS
ncbi:hypothetical protein M2093_002261 [Breznakia sp. PH1-1]|nr:hypothetical protein [Breznakia sp. PH1-1]MDH6405181.1 hypothetical protein [Breznakia sp. PF1-11]MDH6412890.1 hypothetical protein [Breznakia sp. PFB1-11]MDH6415257.1 hypothetical protein [Breznakia sp. PFB1-14]MDH6417561.1 hypothetical protein [Breznakia sp. PFB1-4]MDH6419923.1 hypothetical protein [Breznakia sp. PFB1-12]MDH6474996.1 hypothetical protein [Breznakia sp. PFB2-30]MDH6477301.1 hypothetical protein [Breznakia sp. PFB1-19]